VTYNNSCSIESIQYKRPAATTHRQLVGCDFFIDSTELNADEIATKLQAIQSEGFTLTMISNRGAKVWPEGKSETFCTDHWRCRFQVQGKKQLLQEDIVELFRAITQIQLRCVQMEALYLFDGELGFTKAQGE
jgi:isocitrate dehydrogenase